MNMRSRKQEGLALVLVLWMVTLLTVMATALARTQRVQVAMTGNLLTANRAQALLDAGIQFMMLQLEQRDRPAPRNPWPVDGRLHPWRFAQHRLWIGAVPERTRLDLNRASAEALLQLFLTVEPDEKKAKALRDALLDWRDRDKERHPFGAEDDHYYRAGRPAGARDAPLMTVDELRLVQGMTPELLRRLRPLVTVHQGRRTLDGETASLPLEGGDFEGAGGNRFRLFAEVTLGNDRTFRMSSLVDIRHRTPRGYRMLERDRHPEWMPPRATPAGEE